MGEIRNQEDLELPPRTRRIPLPQPEKGKSRGTTSAHAENTVVSTGIFFHIGNYLRARGEYAYPRCTTMCKTELPPRTRRIRRILGRHDSVAGTTSAHAENTARRVSAAPPGRNYLRARGEYKFTAIMLRTKMELPPRTRRIQRKIRFRHALGGTTSAHAENTG